MQRLFLAEKWLVARLHYGHVDPREAGVGNIVNCGAAMYMAPVGIVNAGDPAGAYAEAIEVDRCAPVELRPRGRRRVRRRRGRGDASGRDVRPGLTRRPGWPTTARGPRSRPASRRSQPGTDWREASASSRPRSPRSTRSARSTGSRRQDPAGPAACGRSRSCPSHSGSSRPPAGTARGTVLGATNYGRDSDSIATMGGALAGALGGEAAVPDATGPRPWRTASRLDLRAGGRTMAAVAAEIFAADEAAWHQRREAFDALLEDRSGA